MGIIRESASRAFEEGATHFDIIIDTELTEYHMYQTTTLRARTVDGRQCRMEGTLVAYDGIARQQLMKFPFHRERTPSRCTASMPIVTKFRAAPFSNCIPHMSSNSPYERHRQRAAFSTGTGNVQHSHVRVQAACSIPHRYRQRAAFPREAACSIPHMRVQAAVHGESTQHLGHDFHSLKWCCAALCDRS